MLRDWWATTGLPPAARLSARQAVEVLDHIAALDYSCRPL